MADLRAALREAVDLMESGDCCSAFDRRRIAKLRALADQPDRPLTVAEALTDPRLPSEPPWSFYVQYENHGMRCHLRVLVDGVIHVKSDADALWRRWMPEADDLSAPARIIAELCWP